MKPRFIKDHWKAQPQTLSVTCTPRKLPFLWTRLYNFVFQPVLNDFWLFC